MPDPPKLSFSLGKPAAKAGPSTTNNAFGASISLKPKPKPVSKAFTFGDDDDDDEDKQAGSSSKPTLAGPSKVAPRNNALIKQNASLGRQAKKIQEEAVKVDQTVFEYDEVWDGMQNARQQAKQIKDEEAAERKPKYIESFLQSAATRKLDRLRAEEKMLQHERDEEGEEYADKEKFVTTAYKRQMEEVKLAEEEEKAREAKERASQKGPGMTAFYRNMLDADEEKHAAAVAASSKSATKPNQGPSLAIRPPDASDNTSDSKPPATFDDTAEEDPFIRRERQRMEMERAMMTAASASVPVVERLPATASTEEERIEINDEGAIVDKRVLLKAGLNITKKPVLPKDGPGDVKRPEVHVPLKSRAVGTDASYEARMARERRRLADQMKDEQERIERERLAKQQEVEETAKKRRAGGDDGEGDAKRRAARERFEARKRAKLEQPEGDGS
ncbi:coiled-coil domain-containing protein 55-domain containing protein [Filobasidium floriforme]|uniref:coiled-coil domain-containing protein 55-domain containing protein n=1 Tax=Filobasidium floriforme TaxID=5210 RepID=UPI001E8E6646|nr:coiled-coil domain-containing protein 55-domain containing protein [Filobasidium floriforme]KAH8083003.1 coiled-coil domain-containing protein 55-domain containing protein [Filobasidium floriforme]